MSAEAIGINYGSHLHTPEFDDWLSKWANSDVKMERHVDLRTRLDTTRNTGFDRARRHLARMTDKARSGKALTLLVEAETRHLEKMAEDAADLAEATTDEDVKTKVKKWLAWYATRNQMQHQD